MFAIKGSGTVVTGTLQAGTVQPGDELTVAPAMRTVRIRGVQSLGAPAAQAGGVARVALNLRGVSTRELGRGMALIQPGRWTVTSVIDVRLGPASGGQVPAPAQFPSRLTLHIGAARAVAQARMLGSNLSVPGTVNANNAGEPFGWPVVLKQTLVRGDVPGSGKYLGSGNSVSST